MAPWWHSHEAEDRLLRVKRVLHCEIGHSIIITYNSAMSSRGQTAARILGLFLLSSFLSRCRAFGIGAPIVKPPSRAFSAFYAQKDDEASPLESNDLLEYAIDAFLNGEYDGEMSDDAPAPHPGLSPGAAVQQSLEALRQLDPPAQGAAVLMQFCVPLTRGERWGDSTRMDPWKEILRGSLTPHMLAQRIRASEFSGLLDWKSLDVTDGSISSGVKFEGIPSVAHVNAALHFGEDTEPTLFTFVLRRVSGVWLIDTAQRSRPSLFSLEDSNR